MDDRYQLQQPADDPDTDVAGRYRDAAVLGSIHTGGPSLGTVLAAAGYARTGAAVTCGSVVATIAYALVLNRNRDEGQEEQALQGPHEAAGYTETPPGGSSVHDGNRQVLAALNEFGVLEDELSPEQQDRYSEEIRDIRADE